MPSIKVKAFGAPTASKDQVTDLLLKASHQQPDIQNAIVDAEKQRAGQVITYPYGMDLSTVAALYDQDPTHRTCCDIKAHAVIANGYRFVRKDGQPKVAPSNMRSLFEALFESGIEDFVVRVGLDFESLGNAYIEVVRDNTGRVKDPSKLGAVVALRHVPAYTMWRLSPGGPNGDFVQVVGTQKVYFRSFMSVENQNLNEIIHLKQYSPSNYWYGVPPIWSALRSVLANRQLLEDMIDLLESKGVSRYLLIMDGAESFIDTSDEDTINQYVNQLLNESARKFLVIGTPADTKSQVKSLRADIALGDMELFRSTNTTEIARVHGVPLRLIQVVAGGKGGGTGKEDEEEFTLFRRLKLRPRQNMWERLFGQSFLASNSKWAQWKIELNDIDLTDFLKQEQANVAYIRSGVYTINEVRGRLGMTPIKDGGDEPLIVSGGVPILVSDVGNARTLNPQANGQGPINNDNQGNQGNSNSSN